MSGWEAPINRVLAVGGDGPDWTRWQDEDLIPYLIRVASQVVFAAGTLIDKRGSVVRDKLWEWADRMLEVAHPTLPPVDIDLGGEYLSPPP